MLTAPLFVRIFEPISYKEIRKNWFFPSALYCNDGESLILRTKESLKKIQDFAIQLNIFVLKKIFFLIRKETRNK